MADFSNIIQEINEEIKQNGANEITGAKLNEVLRDMIAAVNAEKADKRTFEVLHIDQIPSDIASGLLVGDFVIDTSDGRRLYVVTYRNGNDFWLVTSDGVSLVWYSYENNQYSADGYFDSSIVARDIEEILNSLAGKQDTISDLATIRSGAAAGATAYQKPSGGIPKTDLASGVQDTLDDVGDIADMIPAQASASNQLADKNFVNSSITTSTANFVGTYNSLAELQTVQNPTNNDYGFVIETDAQGNQYYDRYKYNGTTWLFEYRVESTAFTAAQWAAIQSGITAGLVNRLGDIIPAGATAQNPLATVGDIPTIPVVDASTIPASMDADKVYQYGTLSGDTTFPPLAAPTEPDIANVYCWTFTTPATAPTITWPSAITSWAGGSAPTINADKHYEVSVMDGLATIIEN